MRDYQYPHIQISCVNTNTHDPVLTLEHAGKNKTFNTFRHQISKVGGKPLTFAYKSNLGLKE